MTKYEYYNNDLGVIYNGDSLEVLKKLPSEFVQTVITSPPYWQLRDYQVNGQIGLEETIFEYVSKLINVFNEVYRVLKKDGTLWLNLGDTYNSSIKGKGGKSNKQLRNKGSRFDISRKFKSNLKKKELCGIPWRIAFALQDAGWYLRQDIIWHKPNSMPESVKDRPTKSHEYLFLMSKSEKYYYDWEAIKEKASLDTHARYAKGRSNNHKYSNGGPGNQTINKSTLRQIVEYRNKRSVWLISTQAFSELHFATFPEKLVEPCILAGSKKKDIILDPFSGSCTVAIVAQKAGRNWIMIDLNKDYCEMGKNRIIKETRQMSLF